MGSFPRAPLIAEDPEVSLQTPFPMELGYLRGEADGLFGRVTQNAVRQFQRFNGLTDDGIAGNATQRTLYDSPDVVPALRVLK